MKHILSSHTGRTVLCVFLIVTAIFVSDYYFIAQTRADIDMQEKQYLNEIAMQNASIVKKTVELTLDKIEAVGNIIGSQEVFSVESTIKLLKLESERSGFRRMGYASYDGMASTTDGESFSIVDREYFRKVIEGQNAVSERLVDKVGGLFINVYGVPIYHKDSSVGIIFATSKTDIFSDILKTTTFGGEGFSYIITKEGAPVVLIEHENGFGDFSSLFEEIGISNSEAIAKMKNDISNNKNGTIRYSSGNVENIAAYCTVGINDWYVVSVAPKDIISKNTDSLIFRNVLTIILTTIVFIFLIFFIVRQNRKTRARLEQIAYFDDLTGAPTLERFKVEAQQFIDDNPKENLVMVKFDIAQFKLINQILGDEVGDTVMKNLVKSLEHIAHGKYFRYARQHDDEFLFLCKCGKVEELMEVREKFQKVFYELMGEEFKYYVKVVAGHYYMSGENCKSILEAIEKANIAHRRAKQTEQEVCVYDEKLARQLLKYKEIENKMELALETGEFKVYLQPKYDIESEAIVGAEALVRWQETDGDIIFPNDFIPFFEQNGFITRIDMHMFEQTCMIIKDWIEKEQAVVPISINFSRLHLKNIDFIDRLVAIMDKHKIPRKYIELELTETVIFENEDILTEVLRQIHKAGLTLSMDDFGTGYSSLGLLKNLPVDVIKIDRSFFSDDGHQERTKLVIESVILMAKKLNIFTVAEGVEKIEHIDLLREVGCDIVQGYYFAKPMIVPQFEELMRK